MAAKVGLLLVLLDEKLVGAGVEFPVNVPDRLPGVVGTVLREFHGEAMHGTFVDARDEPFHDLFGHKFHMVELGDFRQIDCICHIVFFRAQRYIFLVNGE